MLCVQTDNHADTRRSASNSTVALFSFAWEYFAADCRKCETADLNMIHGIKNIIVTGERSVLHRKAALALQREVTQEMYSYWTERHVNT